MEGERKEGLIGKFEKEMAGRATIEISEKGKGSDR